MKKFALVVLVTLIPILSLAQKERWIYRYSGIPGGRSDYANSVVYGADGNLYAAGKSWYHPTKDDFTVISLTNSGIERWIYTYNGVADKGDAANSVIYGEDGNIYAAGSSHSSDTNRDLTVISLTSTGTERWVYKYDGPGNGSDYAFSVVYGADGNIYVTGSCWSTNANTDFTIIGLTSDGAEQWVYHYNGAGNYNDCGRSLIYGADGNIYAVGESFGNGTNDDFTVISLTDSGTERWVYCYNGTGNWADYANEVVYGPDSNIYVIGSSAGSIAFDIMVVCFDSSGTEQWIYRHPENGFPDGGYAGVYGADGNIYVAGAFGDDIPDFMVVSLTDSGTPRWEYIYYTPVYTFEHATSITYGTDGNIYAAGSIADSISGVDFAVVSLTDSGIENWVYLYNRGGEWNLWGCAHAICYGVDGNIYAAGSSEDSITGEDFTVISLDPTTSVEENLGTRPYLPYFEVHPTLVNSKCNIRYFLSLENKVNISIYCVDGRLIKVLINEDQNVGVHKRTIDLDDLAQGVYLIRLRTKEYSDTKKVIRIK